MAEKQVMSVEKALTIMACFHENKQKLSLKALSEMTQINKTTILRLTNTMIAHHYLQRDSQGFFSPGVTLWRLGSLYRREHQMMGDVIRPVLRDLFESTRETASFYVLEGDGCHRICLYRHQLPKPLIFHLDEGQRLPLDKTASGKVLKTFTSPERYIKVIKDGFAVSREAHHQGIAAVAVPVFRLNNSFAGALAISLPLARFYPAIEKSLIDSLMVKAKNLHAQLK